MEKNTPAEAEADCDNCSNKTCNLIVSLWHHNHAPGDLAGQDIVRRPHDLLQWNHIGTKPRDRCGREQVRQLCPQGQAFQPVSLPPLSLGRVPVHVPRQGGVDPEQPDPPQDEWIDGRLELAAARHTRRCDRAVVRCTSKRGSQSLAADRVNDTRP
eukprot:scaffold2741_cov134-Isochrysis_galbana.AAC.16